MLTSVDLSDIAKKLLKGFSITSVKTSLPPADYMICDPVTLHLAPSSGQNVSRLSKDQSELGSAQSPPDI